MDFLKKDLDQNKRHLVVKREYDSIYIDAISSINKAPHESDGRVEMVTGLR